MTEKQRQALVDRRATAKQARSQAREDVRRGERNPDPAWSPEVKAAYKDEWTKIRMAATLRPQKRFL